MPANPDALRQWSQLHDDYDVERSRLVRGWLQMVQSVAAPLARWRVPPNAVTATGVAAATGAVMTARPRSATLVVATALCDGLDGAVAIQRGRSSRHGTAIDHAADRVTDVLFAAALWHAGAGPQGALAAAAMTIGYEGARSLARRSGRTHDLVTVGERPIRVAVTVVGIAVAPDIGAVAIAVLCAAGLIQVFTAG